MLILVAFLSKLFVDRLTNGEGPLGLLVAISACLIFSWLGRCMAFFMMNELAIVVRKGLTALLYRKALRLPLSAVARASPGKLINMCSGDMALVDYNFVWIAYVLAGPLATLQIMALLYRIVGVAVFYALAMSVLLYLLTLPVNSLVLRFQRSISEASDQRIGLIHNLIRGIQTVKSYGWEGPLVRRAKTARRTELARLRRYFFVSGFFDGLLAYCDPLLALPLLLALVLRQVPLDAPTLLFSLSLVSNLSTLGLSPVNCALDSAANLVSIIRRIQNILLLPEHSPVKELPLNTSLSL